MIMIDPEFAEMQFEYGSQSEQQNAYALAHMEYDLNPDHARIQSLLGEGRFVVITCSLAYCPFTDAILGQQSRLWADFPSRKEAQDVASEYNEDRDGETYTVVLPRAAQESPVLAGAVDSATDDIPF